MGKKKEKTPAAKGNPKHSLDERRRDGKLPGGAGARSSATVRRLQMYKTRPTRDSKGKVLHNPLQSRALPQTRIQPDRRWFGNTRVVGQRELERFREEMRTKVADSYTVVLRDKKLPLALLTDPTKQARAHLLDTEKFQDVFGAKAVRKRPKLAVDDYQALLSKAAAIQGQSPPPFPDFL